MFRLIHAPAFGHHVLDLGVADPGFHAYAFTFGSCVVPDR
jgi:hypothetical protein